VSATYQDRLKDHLSQYKVSKLGITANGIWSRNKKPYSHILPAARKFDNFLGAFREELRSLVEESDFHHLNSSQAMCLNLFYPLAADEENRKILTDALGSAAEMARGKSWSFEKVLDEEENTNFDFLYRTSGGATAFFEIKLSEGGFGTAKNDERHRGKLSKIYEPHLKRRVDPTLLEEKKFFSTYQLCRNFSYLQRPGDQLLIVYPKANKGLTKELDAFLGLVNEEHRGHVKAVHLETLVPRILDRLPGDATRLQQHYREFAAKYLPPS
jgi:hypothetical protein